MSTLSLTLLVCLSQVVRGGVVMVRESGGQLECQDILSLDFTNQDPQVHCSSPCHQQMKTFAAGPMYRREERLSEIGLMVRMDYDQEIGLVCSLVDDQPDTMLLQSDLESEACQNLPSTAIVASTPVTEIFTSVSVTETTGPVTQPEYTTLESTATEGSESTMVVSTVSQEQLGQEATESESEAESTTAVTGQSTTAVTGQSTTAVIGESTTAVIGESTTAVIGESTTAVMEESTTAVMEESTTAVMEESTTAVMEESTTAVTGESTTAVIGESTTAVMVESTTAVMEESTTAVMEESTTAVMEESTTAVTGQSTTAVMGESTTAVTEESTTAVMGESTTAVTEELTTAVMGESTTSSIPELTTGGNSEATIPTTVESTTLILCENEGSSQVAEGASERVCGEGWSLFEGSCYHVSSESGSWQSGVDYCSSKGAYLTKTSSEAEWNHVKSQLTSTAWIGLHDVGTEGDFRWNVDNTAPTFYKWGNNEPNNLGGEDCIMMWDNLDYLWNDSNCDSQARYVCEKPAQEMMG